MPPKPVVGTEAADWKRLAGELGAALATANTRIGGCRYLWLEVVKEYAV